MNYSDDLVLNQMLDRNGAIASFVGYWLYTNSIKNLKPKDKRTKYYLVLDKKSLLRELKAYSEDDVKRMIYINTHMSNEDIDKLAKEINQVMNNLPNWMKSNKISRLHSGKYLRGFKRKLNWYIKKGYINVMWHYSTLLLKIMYLTWFVGITNFTAY